MSLNLSKRGTSFSVGRPGASANFSRRGARTTTVGMPGTGLSYSSSRPWHRRVRTPTKPAGFGVRVVTIAILAALGHWFFRLF